MTWFGIAFTYLRFYAGVKAQGLDRSKLPYSSKLRLRRVVCPHRHPSCVFFMLAVFLKDG